MKKIVVTLIIIILLLGHQVAVFAANTTNDIKISYSAHLSNIGWTDYYSDGDWAGRTSSTEETKSYRLEAIRLKLINNTGIEGRIKV